MIKPAFCICENKGANQLLDNRADDQHLCFHYLDSTVPLLPKSKIPTLSILMAVQPGLCRTWSKTLMTGFIVTGLNYTRAAAAFGQKDLSVQDKTLPSLYKTRLFLSGSTQFQQHHYNHRLSRILVETMVIMGLHY